MLTLFLGISQSVAQNSDLTVTRVDNGALWVEPASDPLADEINWEWANYDAQTTRIPSVAEGMFTWYNQSVDTWFVVDIWARSYQQKLARGETGVTEFGELLVYLRGDSIDGYVDRLHERGFDCAVAGKNQFDIGRTATLSFFNEWDATWTPPIRVIVLDSAHPGAWPVYQQQFYRWVDHFERYFRWIVEPSQDCADAAGGDMPWYRDKMRSGIARMNFTDRNVIWPD